MIFPRSNIKVESYFGSAFPVEEIQTVQFRARAYSGQRNIHENDRIYTQHMYGKLKDEILCSASYFTPDTSTASCGDTHANVITWLRRVH